MQAKNVVKLGLCILLSIQPTLAADPIAEAEQYFKQGKLSVAKQFCNAELKAHPKSAPARYLLGSIAAKEGHSDIAVKEFTKALSLDPKGQVGVMSREWIERLSRPPQQATVSPPAAPAATTQSPADIGSINSRKMAEMHSEIQAQCKAEVDRINKDTEIRVTQLKAKMQEDIDGNGEAVPYGRNRYNPARLNQAVKDQYEQLINAAKAEGAEKVRKVQDLYRTREQAIDDAGGGR